MKLVGKKEARYAAFEDDVGSLVLGGSRLTISQLHYTYLSLRSQKKGYIPAEVLRATDHLVQDIGLPGTRMFI